MKFTLYSKEGCSYCLHAKRLLELAKVEYRVYKLGVDFTKEQFISEFGYGSSFPKILVDDKLIGGCLDTYKYLEEKNLV